jgi:hypothetical protein
VLGCSVYEGVDPTGAGATGGGGSSPLGGAAGVGAGLGWGGAGGDTGSGGSLAASSGSGGGESGAGGGGGSAGSFGGSLLDGGDASGGSSGSAGSDAGAVEACVKESDMQLCGRLSKTCGAFKAVDNCGAQRSVASCGACTSLQICNASNTCAMPVFNTVDDTAAGPGTNQWNFVGAGWNHGHQADCYGQANSWDGAAGDFATVAFVGVQISLYARVNDSHGICALSVDGGAESRVDLYATPAACNDLVWTSAMLPYADHTFKLRVTGQKNPASTDTACVVDRVVITQ